MTHLRVLMEHKYGKKTLYENMQSVFKIPTPPKQKNVVNVICKHLQPE